MLLLLLLYIIFKRSLLPKGVMESKIAPQTYRSMIVRLVINTSSGNHETRTKMFSEVQPDILTSSRQLFKSRTNEDIIPARLLVSHCCRQTCKSSASTAVWDGGRSASYCDSNDAEGRSINKVRRLDDKMRSHCEDWKSWQHCWHSCTESGSENRPPVVAVGCLLSHTL